MLRLNGQDCSRRAGSGDHAGTPLQKKRRKLLLMRFMSPPLSRFLTRIGFALALTSGCMLLLTSHSFSLAAHGHSPGSAATVQLSTDPYKNKAAEHQTEVEPDIFAFGSTIVATFQVGRFNRGGSDNIGWATSSDNGATWKNGFLPGITRVVNPKNPYDNVTDPAVAYDEKHNVWLISSLAIVKNGNKLHFLAVIVNRSTDGGHTWGNPVVVNSSQGNLDKDWIVCNNSPTSPYYGNCYDQWDTTPNSLIQLSTSNDGGLSWGQPLSTQDNASGVGGQPLVQPDGTVIVPIDNVDANAVLSFISTDGGASWSSTITVASITAHTVAGNLRDAPLISAAIDSSGMVYVVWQDCRFEESCSANDFVMTTSSDGINWSPVQLIPADPLGAGIDHFLPGLGIDPLTSGSTAHLVLAYYYYPQANCNFSTCQLEIGYTSSMDGGATWAPTSNIAGPMSLSWLANTNQGWMVGDYIATSFAGGAAFPIFEVANAPGKKRCGTGKAKCQEATFTVVSGLS